ncbi:putative Signal recognition particle 19 kDa protein [Nannochloris sp. 'desiccata']|nr:putative Signal recognition particle 19 kDa protein [Chlorella desiccata (nom. nud.)]
MEHDKRVVVYPCYLNSNYTVSQGRKIPKIAACDNPAAPEIYDCVIQGLKLPADIEMKRHPRDWKYPGRIRVQLKDDQGNLVNPDIPTRHTLFLKIAELVPRHPGRSGKAKAGGQAAIAAGPSSGGGGKKGGKKKK